MNRVTTTLHPSHETFIETISTSYGYMSMKFDKYNVNLLFDYIVGSNTRNYYLSYPFVLGSSFSFADHLIDRYLHVLLCYLNNCLQYRQQIFKRLFRLRFTRTNTSRFTTRLTFNLQRYFFQRWWIVIPLEITTIYYDMRISSLCFQFFFSTSIHLKKPNPHPRCRFFVGHSDMWFQWSN